MYFTNDGTNLNRSYTGTNLGIITGYTYTALGSSIQLSYTTGAPSPRCIIVKSVNVTNGSANANYYSLVEIIGVGGTQIQIQWLSNSINILNITNSILGIGGSGITSANTTFFPVGVPVLASTIYISY
jgi:hypothetical protein